jgi:hypothetical protein
MSKSNPFLGRKAKIFSLEEASEKIGNFFDIPKMRLFTRIFTPGSYVTKLPFFSQTAYLRKIRCNRES